MANFTIDQLPALAGTPPINANYIVSVGGGTFRVTGEQLAAAFGGSGGGSGGVTTVQPGLGIAVDDTDPSAPVVSTLLEQGTNVTIVPGTAPNSLRISAASGGGGGSGKMQLSQIAKVGSSPQTVSAAEVDATANTPFIITNAAELNFDLDGLNGLFVVYFVAYVACTVGTSSGARIIDKAGSAVATIACAQYETIEMALVGDGSTNWSIQVLNRY